uniref:Fatty acid desaturase domain-containing protein n=1 Tax=Cuerna arida TaxID=1464854 RepID=A0A1B6FRL5_9HEMI
MVQQLPQTGLPVHEELLDILKAHVEHEKEPKPRKEVEPFRRKIVWFNALGFLALHIAAVYGLYLGLTRGRLLTFLWVLFLLVAAGQGVTMGAHRLYSHKAFKAKPMLRLALVLLQTMAGQNCLYIWVRDHRQHHKYSDTDADPHNAIRGFFFSHIGWLMSRKHPEVIAKGKNIDMSDLEADPFVMFQKKYYKTLYVILALMFPLLVPYWLWGEDIFVSFMCTFVTRTVISLNFTWLVNSAAHKYGNKPYTSDIVPVESELVSICAMGEGWHNYHHTFPWDYKAAELGQKYNLTTSLLDLFASWGWAYDLRAATPAMVQHRVLRRGDGSHPLAATTPDTPEPPAARDVHRRPGL